MQNVKLVIVGDAGVGKTSLLYTYSTGGFPDSGSYLAAFDNDTQNVMVDGRAIALSLWDTAGQDDYNRLRPLSYPQTDVFLLCFAVNDRPSFDRIRTKWHPELSHHAPGVPIILCGMKCDLRSTEITASINDANTLSAEIGAAKYIEVSSKTDVNVRSVFEEAVRTTQPAANPFPQRERRRRRECHCEIDWEEVLNQCWQIFAFLLATSLYIAIDVGALVVGNGYCFEFQNESKSVNGSAITNSHRDGSGPINVPS